MVLLISIGAFLSIMTLLLCGHQFISADQRAFAARLDRLATSMKPSEAVRDEAVDPKGLRRMVQRVSEFLGSAQWERRYEQRLQQASMPISGAEFIVFCLGSAFWGFAVVHLVSGGQLAFALASAVLFFEFPFLLMRIRTRRRMKAFNRQLGDALILIANALRTGYSFTQSFELVAREMQPPMSVEFSRTTKEMNLGMTTEDALEKMSKRIQSNDMDLVITAVLIQRQVGGNLAELLDNLAHTIRERVIIRGHIQTLTAQGRISGIIISLLPLCIGLIIYSFNPDYIRILFTHSVGSKLLIGGVISQIIGILIVRRIVNIKV